MTSKLRIALAAGTLLLGGRSLPIPGASASPSSAHAGTLVISTFAGTGAAGFGGDGGPATSAQLQYLRGMAVDRDDNLYVADAYNHRVRVVTPRGGISTLAGHGGVAGFAGDGGPGPLARLNLPRSVAVDSVRNVYIADLGNNRIRKVDPSGVMSTVAGTGTPDFGGDNGPATSARLNGPAGVAVDRDDTLFIADTGNHRVRKVTARGHIETVAGTGFFGSIGDGGPAQTAAFDRPSGIAIDRAGAIYVADTGNNRIRKISPAGTISTVAGSGTLGLAGDGGPATAAQLSSPKAVAIDGSGRLYIADTGNNRIRQVTPSGTISTIAGSEGSGFAGDGGPAAAAQLMRPYGVAVARTGAVYLADTGNNRIRKLVTATASVASPKPAPSAPAPPRPIAVGSNVYAATTSGKISAALAGVPERVYVPNEGSGTVVVIDPTTLKVVDQFPVGKSPHHVTPSWDMTRLYVNDMDSDSLTEIDPRTGKPLATIPVTAPYNLYYTVDGSKALVVAEPVDRLDFYDPRTWKLIRSLPIPWEGVNHLDMSADGRFLLVSSEFDGFVVKVDLETLAIAGQLDVGALPTDVRLSADGSVFYVANQGRHGVSIIDPDRMMEIGFLATGRGAHGLAVSRDAQSLYVTNRLEGTISVIDLATRQIRAKWTIGGSPDMVQVSPDGRQIWTTSRFDKSIYVVDAATGAVLTKISTDFGPHGLAYFPQPGRFSLGHNGVYR